MSRGRQEPTHARRNSRRDSIGSVFISFVGGALLIACAAEIDTDKNPDNGNSGGSGNAPAGGASGTNGFGGTSGGGVGGGGSAGVGGTGGSGGTGGVSGTAGSGGTVGVSGTAGVSGTGGAGTGGGGVGGTAGTDGSGGNGGAPTCTGKKGVAGNNTRTAMGLQYIVHGPAGLDPNTAVPLVFVAHGFTQNGALMQSTTRYDTIADREKFVVVYPNGHGAAPWNVGNGTCAPGALVNDPNADSFGYFEQMKAAIEADQCINPRQVFVTGFSMGGYFSHNMGCQKGNSFARAVAPHSGGTYPGNCPGAPVPIIIMHGASDTFIDYNACGKTARDYWVQRNKCTAQVETRPVSGGSCEWNQGCDPNGQTVFCSFTGVAHNWAAGAAEVSWAFFKQYL